MCIKGELEKENIRYESGIIIEVTPDNYHSSYGVSVKMDNGGVLYGETEFVVVKNQRVYRKLWDVDGITYWSTKFKRAK